MANVTDLNDTTVILDIRGGKSGDALLKFDKLCNLAHEIETSPCTVIHDTDSANPEVIHAEFNFCCPAEKFIFQLKYLFNSKYKI